MRADSDVAQKQPPPSSSHHQQERRSLVIATSPQLSQINTEQPGTSTHIDIVEKKDPRVGTKRDEDDRVDESTDEDFHSHFVGSIPTSPIPPAALMHDMLPTPVNSFSQSLTAAVNAFNSQTDTANDVVSSSNECSLKSTKVRKTRPGKSISKPPAPSGSEDKNRGQGPYIVQGAEKHRRLVISSDNVHFIERPSGKWTFTKCLGSSTDFLAAGQLVVHPRCIKSSSDVKGYTYVFYVIQGTVNITIHTGSYTLAPGGMFIVPPGNTYSVENTSDIEAKLFFAQARKVKSPDSDDETPGIIHRLLSVPTSRAGILLALLLQQITNCCRGYTQTLQYWYRMNLAPYEPQVRALLSGRKAWILFFLLGYLARRPPLISSPPMKVEIVRQQR